MPQQTGSLVAGDLRLSFRRWPGPPGRLPLVLLHGLTESAAAWQPVVERLARRRTIFAWDARGHGGSDWSAEAAYTSDAHFADVAGALDALGIARCALAGFSMGGSVAILAAGALPERVARLVVVDAYPHPEMSPGSRQIAEWTASLARRDDVHLPFDPAIARAMAEELSCEHPRRLDLWPFWEAGDQPALVVRGALSQVLTDAMAAEMLRRRPGAGLVTIPGVAHAIVALKPAALAAALDEFLAEC